MTAAPRTARQEFAEGWPVMLSAAMGVGLSAVMGYSLGVFIGPLKHAFGWSPAMVVAGQSLMSLVVSLGSPFGGWLMDRVGARPVALSGTLVISAGVALLATIPNSFAAYLACYGVIGLGVVFCSAMIWQRFVVDRFVVARGLALSLVLCGSNVAGSVAPLLATWAIEQHGWRYAFLVLAAYMLLSALPLAWWVFRPLADVDGPAGAEKTRARELPGMDIGAAARTLAFWLLVVSFFFAGIGITGYITHLVPMLTERGLTPMLAASAVSSLSVAAIGGRIATGVLLDRVFAPWLASFALALPVLGSIALYTLPFSYALAVLAGMTVGLSTGAEFNMISYLTARYFGLRKFGAISGLLFGVFTLGCLAGQQIPNFILRMGTYSDVVVLFGACFAIAALAMPLCGRYPAASTGH